MRILKSLSSDNAPEFYEKLAHVYEKKDIHLEKKKKNNTTIIQQPQSNGITERKIGSNGKDGLKI